MTINKTNKILCIYISVLKDGTSGLKHLGELGVHSPTSLLK